ncbi:phage holin family protein [Pseudolysinimonas sp.]|uniref:phage holin family protein n=1 Tax=Pseudolysinimonas sp. TaxID=2680009 RepID=UPI003F7D8A9B
MASATRSPSLVELVSELPGRVTDLVHAEIQLLKTEVIGKIKSLGIGAGLLLGAVIVLGFMFGVLLTAAILALSLVLPGWLAALLVAAVLLIVAVILALIGWRVLKRGIPPIPSESLHSLQSDVRTIRGLGKRGAA